MEQVHYVGDSRVRAKKDKFRTPDYAEFPGNNEAFLPDFLLKEWMVGAVFLVAFMTLVMAHVPAIGEVADPTNSSFLPVPDWYFLFLYQILKYKWASGDFNLVGLLLPGFAFGALLLAPWLDRSNERRVLKRPIASSIMILSLISIIYLTWAAEAEHIEQLESAPPEAPETTDVVAVEDEGYKLYSESACITCHGENLEGKNGPSLLGVGNYRTAEEIDRYIVEGKNGMPAGMFQGTPEQREVLVEWLLKQQQK
ncbi:c-type cytochrome [Hazenella sp. IB182357]|uniref:C-type cytochrome n=2 Tax=Polycladospora coralii TaxID=2771432 RepID=A0A926NAE9_9BACL|nr:menaquinol-cytochrome c reductase cytochrome b/c subunit [Polycladospora coralii]MBD1371600.1 c-type cytochrome [Polycladospora coralii]MBS7529067.1 c-type cytochrome [Polycladospora coralii]